MPDEEKVTSVTEVVPAAAVEAAVSHTTEAAEETSAAANPVPEPDIVQEVLPVPSPTTEPAPAQEPPSATQTSEAVSAPVAVPAPAQEAAPTAPHFGHYSVKEAQALSSKARTSRIHHETERILAYVSAHGSVSKDEAARFLHVAGSTAYRYLSFLVKEGKLKREGRSRAVRYVP